jgi:hypothetical protein
VAVAHPWRTPAERRRSGGAGSLERIEHADGIRVEDRRRSPAARAWRAARNSAGAVRLRRGPGGDRRCRGASRPRLHDGRRRPPRHARPGGRRRSQRSSRCVARATGRSTARLGTPSLRPPRDSLAYLRPRPDARLLCAGGFAGHANVPLRGAQRGRARRPDARAEDALSGSADRRRVRAPAYRLELVGTVPRADRRRGSPDDRGDRRLGRRDRLGRHGPAAPGALDGADAAPAGGPDADRRRRGVRLPRRAGGAGSALARPSRPRMGLPPGTRAAATVASLPALQPALRARCRTRVRRGWPQEH